MRLGDARDVGEVIDIGEDADIGRRLELDHTLAMDLEKPLARMAAEHGFGKVGRARKTGLPLPAVTRGTQNAVR